MTNVFEKAVEHIVRLTYSKEKKIERYVIVLTVIGFIIRLIASLNLDSLADDMIYASQSAGIISSGILSTHSNPPLFFYMTDLAYKVLGYTTFASRFWPLIFGTLMIPLVFLIGKKMFNEKVGLFAALVLTFTNFLVRMTFSEQSLMVFFFCFFGIYLGMVYLENRQKRYIIWSAILFGLGILTKYNAPFFILAFLVYAGYYEWSRREKIFSKKNVKNLIAFLAIIFVFALPFLSFNYFIYKESGIVDVYFSRIVQTEKTQQIYSGLAGQDDSFFKNITKFDSFSNWNLVYKTDLVLFVLAIVGLIVMAFKKEKKGLIMFGIFLLIPFILQSGGSSLQKHFAFMHFLFVLPAGYLMGFLAEKIKMKYVTVIILILIAGLMIFNLGHNYGTPKDYLSTSPTSQLKSYVNDNSGESKLFVFDDRIYTARVFWEATDNTFVTLGQLPDLIKYSATSKNLVNVKTYFIECAVDDCGWGWVADNQQLNQSEEGLLAQVKNVSKLEKTIYSNKYVGNEFTGLVEREPYYRVYSTTIQLDAGIPNQARKAQSFYFAPYMYIGMSNYIYNYQVFGIDELLDKTSWGIIWLAIVLAIISVIVVFTEL